MSVSDVLEVVGALIVCLGVWFIYWPAALLLLGAFVIIAGLALDRGVAK